MLTLDHSLHPSMILSGCISWTHLPPDFQLGSLHWRHQEETKRKEEEEISLFPLLPACSRLCFQQWLCPAMCSSSTGLASLYTFGYPFGYPFGSEGRKASCHCWALSASTSLMLAGPSLQDGPSDLSLLVLIALSASHPHRARFVLYGQWNKQK